MNLSKIFELIYELILRYRDGGLRGEVKKTADTWFSAYDAADADDADFPWLESDLGDFKAQTLNKAYNSVTTRLSSGSWLGIAASVIFVSLISYVGWRVLKQPTIESIAITTPFDVILPDGTFVHLEAGSTIRYPKNFSDKDRRVTLIGDAFFDVAKDPSRPFTITCGELETRVLGTSFSIDSQPSGDVTVVVAHGRVALSSGKAHVVLVPHERGIFSHAENTISKSRVDSMVWNSLVASHYSLNFNDVRFSDVLHTLEVRFEVTFTLENKLLGDCRLTANLSGQSLDTVLDLASKSLGFEYTIDGHTINIKGNGCSWK